MSRYTLNCIFCHKILRKRGEICENCFRTLINKFKVKESRRMWDAKVERDRKGIYNCIKCGKWLIFTPHHYLCENCYEKHSISYNTKKLGE